MTAEVETLGCMKELIGMGGNDTSGFVSLGAR